MALKIENITDGKILGIGTVSVLPGETKEVPKAYEHNPILEVYKNMGFAKITGKVASEEVSAEDKAAQKAMEKAKAEASAEELRKSRLASLEGISDEDLGQLANELGINPAECKDMADVLKKVKSALKK